MQSVAHKVGAVVESAATPRLVFKQPMIADQKDLVMTDSHPNPLIGQLGGVDCLSIIKDEDTTLKLSEINGCTTGSVKASARVHVDDSDFLNDSNASECFMANPASDNTNAHGLDGQLNAHTRDGEHRPGKAGYATSNGAAKDDWTMDVPTIKYNDERLSSSSDSKSA